jgi:hypothetical protein
VPDAANIISLSLVSHTNVGKTTLARTLLSQSVGEVRDEPHVTDTNDRFELAQTPQGDQLVLWDTPGFGDSARLARRLLQSDRPIGWFVSQVWDRFADRALWSSQQAVHNVREEADVVLYLVNAAENPEDAGYVEPEMKILAWIGKPIIVLLNQMGPPAGHQAEEAEIDRWRSYLTRFGNVHQVLALDAFARCWVQEGALLQAVEPLLLQAKKPAFGRLNRLWQNQRRQTFDRSMHILATRLAATALDRERIPNSSLKDQLREVGKVLGVSRSPQDDAKQQAMAKLAERLNTAIRQSTDELIEANGLVGHATDEVLSRMADHYDVTENLNEGHAAVVGGLVTGALAGLKADLLAGGLTLGGGMIAGGVLGALGGAGLARGYNMVRGIDAITVTWTDAVMNRLIQSALLTYLAVAHYGRGRGEWAQSEHPAHWEKTVTDVLTQQHDQFTQFWRKRQNYGPDALASALQTELTLAMERILIRLYPNALSMAALGSGARRLNIALAADLAEARGDNPQPSQQAADEPEYAAHLRAGFAAARGPVSPPRSAASSRTPSHEDTQATPEGDEPAQEPDTRPFGKGRSLADGSGSPQAAADRTPADALPRPAQEGPATNGSPQTSSPADAVAPAPDASPSPEDRKPAAPLATPPKAAPSPARQPDSAPITDDTAEAGNSASPAHSSSAKTDTETATTGSDTATDASAAPAKADDSAPADPSAADGDSTTPDVRTASSSNVTPDAPAAPSDDKAVDAPAAADEGAATNKARAPADDGAPASPKPDADTPAADVSATSRRGGPAPEASETQSPRRKQGSGKGRRKRR